MLFYINEVIFGLLAARRGDRLVVPSMARADIVLEIREGVNEKTKHVAVSFQYAAKELLPAP